MMLAIVNITKDDSQELDDYEIRINTRVIGTFQHKRVANGAAQCLRDAADALEKTQRDKEAAFLEWMLPVFNRMEHGDDG